MTLYPMKLVTVICEALAREPLIQLLDSVGAHGYTLFSVEGKGAKGSRPADIAEFANIQVEVIVPPVIAEQLLKRVQDEFFPRFAVITYLADVQVLRGEKF